MFSKEKFNQMIDDQIGNLNIDEKQQMFEAMIEKCCKAMTEDEFENAKSKFMKRKSDKMKSNPMMEMMSSMMGGMQKSRMGGNSAMMRMCTWIWMRTAEWTWLILRSSPLNGWSVIRFLNATSSCRKILMFQVLFGIVTEVPESCPGPLSYHYDCRRVC